MNSNRLGFISARIDVEFTTFQPFLVYGFQFGSYAVVRFTSIKVCGLISFIHDSRFCCCQFSLKSSGSSLIETIDEFNFNFGTTKAAPDDFRMWAFNVSQCQL
jgi:hypothetical protein